jgi:hypothetical protein
VWSYYGAVFFQGEIEYPENKTLWRETPNEVVRVGVNLEGIHIINDKDNTVKLSLPYGKLRYNSQEDPEDGDGCFIVEFSLDDAPHLAPKKSKSSDVSRTQTLTIWTRQAAMIDALATRYLDELDKWQDYLREKTLLRTQQQDRRIGRCPQCVCCILRPYSATRHRAHGNAFKIHRQVRQQSAGFVCVMCSIGSPPFSWIHTLQVPVLVKEGEQGDRPRADHDRQSLRGQRGWQRRGSAARPLMLLFDCDRVTDASHGESRGHSSTDTNGPGAIQAPWPFVGSRNLAMWCLRAC